MKRFEIYNAIKRSDESSVRVSMFQRAACGVAVYYWARLLNART